MSEYVDLSAALDGRLNSMPGSWNIAWENRPFTPVDDELYLRPTLLTGQTVGATIGADGTDDSVGIYQVDVFAPVGKGKKKAIETADLIADRFKPVTELTYGAVTVRAVRVSRAPAKTEQGRYRIPVEVTYQTYTTKR